MVVKVIANGGCGKGDFHLGAHNLFFFSQHLGVISLNPQPEVVVVYQRLSDEKGKNCPLE